MIQRLNLLKDLFQVFNLQAFKQTHSRTSSSTSQCSKSNEMISNIDRLVQLQIQLHEWKEEDLNNYKRKIAEQQKEIPEGSSSEEILAIGENKGEKGSRLKARMSAKHCRVLKKS